MEVHEEVSSDAAGVELVHKQGNALRAGLTGVDGGREGVVRSCAAVGEYGCFFLFNRLAQEEFELSYLVPAIRCPADIVALDEKPVDSQPPAQSPATLDRRGETAQRDVRHSAVERRVLFE